MGQVVKLTDLGNDIVQITMEDKAVRNTFSIELVKGIIDAFDHVKHNPLYKVIVLTGYENYFCCGGTKEELFKIYRGDRSFNDVKFYTLPLDCEIPVISAMQGHAIGGGFVFGLYSDFSILGRENIYTTNFMKYGFTPGMGATVIVSLRLGEIGNEMMFSAENYRGGDLKERGIPLKVVPKADVLNQAIALAHSLAEKPRLSLVTLKNHLASGIRSRINEIIEQELKMHEITFRQVEVADRIQSLFGK